jgi:hypothetical protein
LNCDPLFSVNFQTKAPAKKAVAAKPQLKPSKPPTKPKKKILVDKDDNADDSVMDIDEVESGDGSTRPKEPAPPKKKKTASETYTKVCIREVLRMTTHNSNLAVVSTRAYSETS